MFTLLLLFISLHLFFMGKLHNLKKPCQVLHQKWIVQHGLSATNNFSEKSLFLQAEYCMSWDQRIKSTKITSSAMCITQAITPIVSELSLTSDDFMNASSCSLGRNITFFSWNIFAISQSNLEL